MSLVCLHHTDVDRVAEALDAAWRVLDAVECVGDAGNQHAFAGFVSVITEPALFACDEMHTSKTSTPGLIRMFIISLSATIWLVLREHFAFWCLWF